MLNSKMIQMAFELEFETNVTLEKYSTYESQHLQCSHSAMSSSVCPLTLQQMLHGYLFLLLQLGSQQYLVTASH